MEVFLLVGAVIFGWNTDGWGEVVGLIAFWLLLGWVSFEISAKASGNDGSQYKPKASIYYWINKMVAKIKGKK